ncbi:MAG: hypothetical protein PHQ67_05120 [Fermentimonas sp.]|nr:hypothetical protein [Fermentimonas sp.]
MKVKPVAPAILLITLCLFLSEALFSQIGISVSPPRLYYQLKPGETGTQKVMVSNISKEYPMNLLLTFGDWKYDDYGHNLMFPPDSLDSSCASWLSLEEGTLLTLEPGEQREMELSMTIPLQSTGYENVQTAMLYVTQMNAVDGVDAGGAVVRVNVRQGVKVYRSGDAPEIKKLEIRLLTYDREKNSLILVFKNLGNIWINGQVTANLFNQSTGNEFTLEKSFFYTLPGDLRTMSIPLGNPLVTGNYIATVMLDYGDDTTLEAAELQFSHD